MKLNKLYHSAIQTQKSDKVFTFLLDTLTVLASWKPPSSTKLRINNSHSLQYAL